MPSSSKSSRQATLTQLDYVVQCSSAKKVKREKVEDEVEVVKVTPPVAKRHSGRKRLSGITLREIKAEPLDLDSYSDGDDGDEEDPEEDPEVVARNEKEQFSVHSKRYIIRYADPFKAGRDVHVGMGLSTSHIVDPKYAGYYNDRTAFLMRGWVSRVSNFTRDLRTRASGRISASRFDFILDVVKNQISPLEEKVRDFDGVLIKAVTVDFLKGYFAFESDYLMLMHYFSSSTEFSVKYIPDLCNRDFDLETTFSCGKTWVFGN